MLLDDPHVALFPFRRRLQTLSSRNPFALLDLSTDGAIDLYYHQRTAFPLPMGIDLLQRTVRQLLAHRLGVSLHRRRAHRKAQRLAEQLCPVSKWLTGPKAAQRSSPSLSSRGVHPP